MTFEKEQYLKNKYGNDWWSIYQYALIDKGKPGKNSVEELGL